QGWQGHVSSKASETYEAGAEAKIKGDMATAKAKFQEVAKSRNGNYKALALMELAAMAVNDNNDDEAIKDFDAASRATHSPILSDTAAYKAALLVMDKAPYSEVEKRLKPLAADKRALSSSAREALALAKLQNGDVKGARTDLQLLSLDLDAPDGVKRRAQAEVIAIDSGAAQTALASLKLPEAKTPMLLAPGLPAGADAGGDAQMPQQ
ncbi:MAG: tetratricopeptide repeat protein, partial [Asticcacaulis sp.]